MRKSLLLFLCTAVCIFSALPLAAQGVSKKSNSEEVSAEDDSPIMFKFEPDFTNKNEKRRAEIALTRSIIDTLDVSERRRLKLLRDLYKNGVSKRLQKAILVDNIYEEDIDD